ncbi:hypothetical protein CALVIDRAFT_412006 [Calocera viscosa TUFC12733]|uniref:Uncharacterized protein n=1 Tax=Calocera viscosa (strain TUFC12733) TaxID=1330018 RepID=A0A167G505_CALVF|nr:hypothetical protein CALVIDRAFT_412006 [Calocera viscosa TUFC12733]
MILSAERVPLEVTPRTRGSGPSRKKFSHSTPAASTSGHSRAAGNAGNSGAKVKRQSNDQRLTQEYTDKCFLVPEGQRRRHPVDPNTEFTFDDPPTEPDVRALGSATVWKKDDKPWCSPVEMATKDMRCRWCIYRRPKNFVVLRRNRRRSPSASKVQYTIASRSGGKGKEKGSPSAETVKSLPGFPFKLPDDVCLRLRGIRCLGCDGDHKSPCPMPLNGHKDHTVNVMEYDAKEHGRPYLSKKRSITEGYRPSYLEVIRTVHSWFDKKRISHYERWPPALRPQNWQELVDQRKRQTSEEARRMTSQPIREVSRPSSPELGDGPRSTVPATGTGDHHFPSQIDASPTPLRRSHSPTMLTELGPTPRPASKVMGSRSNLVHPTRPSPDLASTSSIKQGSRSPLQSGPVDDPGELPQGEMGTLGFEDVGVGNDNGWDAPAWVQSADAIADEAPLVSNTARRAAKTTLPPTPRGSAPRAVEPVLDLQPPTTRDRTTGRITAGTASSSTSGVDQGQPASGQGTSLQSRFGTQPSHPLRDDNSRRVFGTHTAPEQYIRLDLSRLSDSDLPPFQAVVDAMQAFVRAVRMNDRNHIDASRNDIEAGLRALVAHLRRRAGSEQE